MKPQQQRILSGFASYELSGSSGPTPAGHPVNYFPSGFVFACAMAQGTNVKVNQNCLNLSDDDFQGRGQSQNEPAVAANPNNPAQLVATYNDYRRGDGNCGSSFSYNYGHDWVDSVLPMSFTRGSQFGADREYWQAGGDTSVAWDTKGNAYVSCQVFNRGIPPTSNADLSSALLVFRSTQNGGASVNFPGRYVSLSADVSGSGAQPFEDKQYLTVDNKVGSPYQDRVYVSWTEFSADGTAYIWAAYSSDYGEHFSPRALVSKSSPSCTNTFGIPTPQGLCNENQDSMPFTGPDGALYVVYANYNNQPTSGNDNHYQVMLNKSTNGGVSFGTPVKVADFYELPDCPAYTGGKDPFRACVPEKGPTSNSFFRANNYPVGAVNPLNPSQVAVTFGSYVNSHSKESNGCVPAGFSGFGNPLYTGVKTAGACNNDILLAVSGNGGTSFGSADPRTLTSVNQGAGQATSDQFWQWTAFARNGRLATSYLDRQYGNDEVTGFSDVSLSASSDLSSFATTRVTSSSMPPPTQFDGVFYGDYSGLTVDANLQAHPVWPDTRNADLFACFTPAPTVCTKSASNADVANDQDIFTLMLALP